MNTTTNIYLSKQGMKDLKKSVAALEREQKQIIADLRELDKTDGHDERYARIEKLAQLETTEGELADKKSQLAIAKPFPRKRDALRVAIGSVVDLADTTGRMVRYTIVDSIEANPSDGRISIKSPLGQNLIGKTISDTVKWGAGLKIHQFQLVHIS
jgi:transcription elongation factor GreA